MKPRRPPAQLPVAGCQSPRWTSAGERPQRQPATGNRQLLVLTAAIIALALFAPTANACPVCYGAPGDPLVKGASNGVWVLLGFVAFVQIGFVAMFWSFWRRAKTLKKFRDQLHVVEGGGGQTILSVQTSGQTRLSVLHSDGGAQ